MTFSLSEKQAEQRDLASGVARHILAFGGSRSGKTFGFCYCISKRALMAPGSRHGIFRLHNVDAKQAVLMDTFPKMMSAAMPDIDYSVNKSDQVVYLGDGSEIWFSGLDDKERVEKVLGKEYATIYLGECSQLSYPSVRVLRTRLAQNVNKVDGRPLRLKAYYDLNPVGKRHWTYVDILQGVQPETKEPFPPNTRAVIQMNPVDNPNLSDEYLEELATLPERDRKRFMEGSYQEEVPGTLWPLERLDKNRRTEGQVPEMNRIVIGVDPSGGDGSGNDSQGIVAAGRGTDNAGYVLKDDTCSKSPAGWARQAVNLYHRLGADCIVAEGNYGGAMVLSTIRSVDSTVKVKLVTATRGKHVRAEPIAALYEEILTDPAKVFHVGLFPELEEQMAAFTTDGYQGAGSPDRADALVWALTELMLGKPAKAGLLVKASNRRTK